MCECFSRRLPQNAITINEFADARWQIPDTNNNADGRTVGDQILFTRGIPLGKESSTLPSHALFDSVPPGLPACCVHIALSAFDLRYFLNFALLPCPACAFSKSRLIYMQLSAAGGRGRLTDRPTLCSDLLRLASSSIKQGSCTVR